MRLFLRNIIMGWVLIFPAMMWASEECCLQHGNVCGDKCCDGTPFRCGKVQIIFLPPTEAPSESKPLPADKPASAEAKWLYTWRNSQTGVLYLSSNLPPWYRNAQIPNPDDYPRVLVFDEYNRLVDDTHSMPTPKSHPNPATVAKK